MENTELFHELDSLLKSKFSEDVKELILFGSRNDGTADEESDYNFLVILRHKSNWKLEREISDACYELELKYAVLIDLHYISETEIESVRGRQAHFINAIEKGSRI
ncbi:MAG: nucleotidyltransferase domain-containing protein [Bacteroidales bacterium]